MKRNIMTIFVISAFMLSACATEMTTSQKGAATGLGIGAATGAVLGQAIGRDTQSTVLGALAGAAAGGIAGGMIGSYMDKQQQDLQRSLAPVQGAAVQRQADNLFVTFKSDLMFDVGSAALKPGAYQDINRVADILQRYPETRLEVNGYTDSRGSEAYNMDLSERRAEAVRRALVDSGVDPRRIAARGYGASMPITTNATETGRQLNRRVTIEIIPIEA